MANTRFRFHLACLLVVCTSCTRATGGGSTLPSGDGPGTGGQPITPPESVTEETFAGFARQLRTAPIGTPGRQELRQVLIEHLAAEFTEERAEGNADGAYDHFRNALLLFQPTELTPSSLGEPSAAMARGVVELFEPRGDEARVLTALLALSLAEPSNEAHLRRYEEIASWSDSVRRVAPSAAERVMGLVRVYEEVTSLIPLDDPVGRLSSLYVERHGLLQITFGAPGGLGALLSPQRTSELQSLLASRGRSVLDLVALYLRAGRPSEVQDMTRPLEPLSSADRELLRAARDLRSSRRGARSRALLAATLGGERPRVALRLCHEGRRQYPADARFPACLAELYRNAGDSAGALEYYEATLEHDTSLEAFERALGYVSTELEVQLADEDPRRARETFERAERFLEAFAEQHPSREPPIRADQLAFLVGMGEFNAGNIDEAVDRLEASVAAHPSRDALLQLGMIAERRGDSDEAVRRYREALDLREGPRENPLHRAIVLEHLASAYAGSGDSARATTLYREALEMLRVAETTLPPDRSPTIRMERGFVLHELGRPDEAQVELEQAVASASQRQATYGRLLSFLVGRGLVRPAAEVFRRAFNHSDLDRMWKIYFSMWLVGLQRRLGQEPEPTAVRFLQSVDGGAWIERLARFYAGNLPYDQLIAAAETRGQQAEARYYEAVLRLAAGQRTEADDLLRQVIETNMMGYYEYEFARRLREEIAGSATAPSSTPTPPAPSTR